jgi:hypothetical protein
MVLFGTSLAGLASVVRRRRQAAAIKAALETDIN